MLADHHDSRRARVPTHPPGGAELGDDVRQQGLINFGELRSPAQTKRLGLRGWWRYHFLGAM
jgi:hypothetical protein